MSALLPTDRETTALADPSGQLWWDSMLAGDFETAWRVNDHRRAAGIPDDQQMWDGSPVTGGHVMLRCLHGLGDAIQLLRYAPLLRQQARSLTVEVAPRLVDLARCFPGIDRVITWGLDAPAEPPAWDVQIEVNELPYFFRTTLTTIPSPTLPYLKLPSRDMEAARKALTPIIHPRIGLAWQSSEWDPSRSLPMMMLLDPVRSSGAQLVSLQTPRDEAEWRGAMAVHPFLHTANVCGEGLLPLACAVAELDLVISVDTMVAHLAGALGRPVWLLLQHNADWRWMNGRNDSPWYPTMRLFRQPAPAKSSNPSAAWEPVVSELGAEFDRYLPAFASDPRSCRGTSGTEKGC